MLIGYARVSTEDQKLDLQKDALIKAGVEPVNIYEEYVSGVKTNRPQFKLALRHLREGDCLVVWRLDRLGRSLIELVTVAQELAERKVELRSLTESIDTTTAGGRLIFNVFAAVAQFERDIISERTKAGLAAARARGRRGGRKGKLKPEQIRLALRMIEDPLLTMEQIAKALGVARSTLHRTLAHATDEKTKLALDKLRLRDRNRLRDTSELDEN